MPVLVTGGAGALARAVADAAAATGRDDVVRLSRDALDVTDEQAVRAAVATHRPRCVLHLAARTDVDACERDPAGAERVHVVASRHVARACADTGARLVHVSTDLVFGGRPPVDDAGGPRGWRHDDPPAPEQVYGRTKLAAEAEVLSALEDVVVVRTAVLAGPHDPGFVGRVAARALAGEPLRVVVDQVASPTFTDDLAPALLELLDADVTGVVHRVGRGAASRHELAVAAVAALGLDVEVAAATSDEWPDAAPRPAWSVLDQSRADALGLRAMPAWRESLARFVASHGPRLRAGATT